MIEVNLLAEKFEVNSHVPFDEWYDLERRLEILSRMTTDYPPNLKKSEEKKGHAAE
jgi:hypothetical protein